MSPTGFDELADLIDGVSDAICEAEDASFYVTLDDALDEVEEEVRFLYDEGRRDIIISVQTMDDIHADALEDDNTRYEYKKLCLARRAEALSADLWAQRFHDAKDELELLNDILENA